MLKEENNILIYLRRKFRRKREKTEIVITLKKITSDLILIS